eukprot:80711-Chlamydomonas_euryale.AAC.3
MPPVSVRRAGAPHRLVRTRLLVPTVSNLSPQAPTSVRTSPVPPFATHAQKGEQHARGGGTPRPPRFATHAQKGEQHTGGGGRRGVENVSRFRPSRETRAVEERLHQPALRLAPTYPLAFAPSRSPPKPPFPFISPFFPSQAPPSRPRPCPIYIRLGSAATIEPPPPPSAPPGPATRPSMNSSMYRCTRRSAKRYTSSHAPSQPACPCDASALNRRPHSHASSPAAPGACKARELGGLAGIPLP